MIPYIIHAGLILGACLAFYKLLLQRETFYRLNRFVLAACLIVSFGLPLIPVPGKFSIQPAVQSVSQKPVTTVTPANFLPVIEKPANAAEPITVAENAITWESLKTWALWLYWFGVIALGLNFLMQLFILLYRAYSKPAIIDGRYRIVELNSDAAPCSFGNNIFINPAKYDWETYNQILLHEKIHIRDGHTADILLAELVLIFQWFNPFAWVYRKELETNLEYLTDENLLRQDEVDKSSYQLSLLKVSAPHFPLSLTTNYNQSLLKKRLVMMNRKKSNLHTGWKYLFIIPVLVTAALLLNKPLALAQDDVARTDKNAKQDQPRKDMRLDTEGAWFATIKADKVSVQFKNDDDVHHSSNSSTFLLSELGSLPRDKSGTFEIKREAGTMQCTGKFEGEQGMGRYKFVADKNFADYLKKEAVDVNDEEDMMVFFFVDLRRSYVEMLKKNGYDNVKKHDLIPLAALKIDEKYITSIKESGFADFKLRELIPLKSLNVDREYIQEIRNAGYKNVTLNQLVTFKSQGINGKYIKDMRDAAKTDGRPSDYDNDEDFGNQLVSRKALGVDADYIKSVKDAGFSDVSNGDLIAMKALGIDGAFIKSTRAAFGDIRTHDVMAIKSLDITPEYIRSFESVGFKDL
ncbi:MAG: M56 family metallopeptidase, partial [Gemmatimonadaceae bacterium]|nr:M56 family metallopeptidase [Chitinophagaceae bacterium]